MSNKGFQCECGHYNEFPGYVHAHWNDKLSGPCGGKCGRTHTIQRGSVIKVKGPVKQKKALAKA